MVHFFGKEGIKIDNIILDIQHVQKDYGKKTILKPITYQLSKGKVLALCGGNGAGKSTLIRMIAGLSMPTKGTISINGISKGDNKKKYLNQIGYVPDEFQFQASISAKETIYFYAKLKGIRTNRIKEVIDLVGLTDSLDKKVGTFSKGMNQRLLIAQALLTESPLLLLDEPTNGLDPYWVQKFARIIMQAKRNGQTIVFSTHDLNVAEEISDEVIFLYDGEVISMGEIQKYETSGLYRTFQELIFQLRETS